MLRFAPAVRRKHSVSKPISDGVRFASDAQAWALKPAAFGGGSGAFTGLTWQDLGYEISGTTYDNLNGTWLAPSTLAAPSFGSASERRQ